MILKTSVVSDGRSIDSLHELILSLRTATVSEEWKLDKQQTSNDDLLDSYRLSLCNYELPKTNP